MSEELIRGAFADHLPLDNADALMAFAFRDQPVFRQRYDFHVRQWDKHMSRRLWRRYWSDREFARAYDLRVLAEYERPACRGRELEVRHG